MACQLVPIPPEHRHMRDPAHQNKLLVPRRQGREGKSLRRTLTRSRFSSFFPNRAYSTRTLIIDGSKFVSKEVRASLTQDENSIYSRLRNVSRSRCLRLRHSIYSAR